MKLILTLLGVVLLVVAAVYFVVPADQLPGFFPGHAAGRQPCHIKHGIVAAVVGVVLLGGGAMDGTAVRNREVSEPAQRAARRHDPDVAPGDESGAFR